MDRRKDWRSAERLLKQGKVQAALEQLGRISDDGPGGVVTLNRLADLLAHLGRSKEAIGYYAKIAHRFEQGGFEPKAIAIHKKILRLNPECLDSAIRLGELYGRQKLHGEARKYLLHAANRYLEAGELGKAREVFEQLVEREPDDLRHRVRLAETRVAEGDEEAAAAEFLGVGKALLERGESAEAEKIFERAAELAPDSDGALAGRARCLEMGGSIGDALNLLEPRLGGPGASVALVGEAARLYEASGRTDDALKLLREAPALEIPADMWVRMFSAALERGEADALWDLLDPIFEEHARKQGGQAWVDLLTRLSLIENEGHLPALVRLAREYETCHELRGAVRALDRLANAYRARSMQDEAAATVARMRAVAPPDEEPRVASEETLTVEPTSLAGKNASPQVELPFDAEAPGVPLNRSDEEFASGRITQAEVLEKYDLQLQALGQLDEVVTRFPGHVEAQGRRVELIRALDEPGTGRLAEALAHFSVACRAAGDMTGARRAAAEAVSLRELPTASRRLLERLELTASPRSAAATAEAPPPAPVVRAAPSKVEVAAAPKAERAAIRAETPIEAAKGEEVVIDLDGDHEPANVARSTGGPAAKPSVRIPSADMLDDIRGELAGGKVADARRRLDALVVLGYAGGELDQLRQEVESSTATAVGPLAREPQELEAAVDDEQAEVEVAADEATASEPPALVDEDFDAIKAALEEELLGEDTEPIVPEEPEDESLEQILQAFRKRVDEEVDAGDHRTHYELGIGLKEMGLLDEAIQELRMAVGAPGLRREACSMLALCHRERRDTEEAARWYRAALEQETADSEAAQALRYDLADLLLEAGDSEAALDHFRNIMALDPAFRDVSGRVSALESELKS